jgi:hypothetical protein
MELSGTSERNTETNTCAILTRVCHLENLCGMKSSRTVQVSTQTRRGKRDRGVEKKRREIRIRKQFVLQQLLAKCLGYVPSSRTGLMEHLGIGARLRCWQSSSTRCEITSTACPHIHPYRITAILDVRYKKKGTGMSFAVKYGKSEIGFVCHLSPDSRKRGSHSCGINTFFCNHGTARIRNRGLPVASTFVNITTWTDITMPGQLYVHRLYGCELRTEMHIRN